MVPQPDMDPQVIKKSVEDLSGFPFELEIVRRLEGYKDYGFWVEPNYSFEDHDTGEARELDFHAITAESISIKRWFCLLLVGRSFILSPLCLKVVIMRGLAKLLLSLLQLLF
jgi:hypothetical protein